MSDEKLKRLSDWGCDIVAAAERLGGEEELLLTCIDMFLADEAFKGFSENLDKKDYKEAFNCIHSLKGISGNLGLAPFYEAASEIVSDMRALKYDKLKEQFDALLELRESLRAAVADN